MSQPYDNILMAFLLALYDLDITLNNEERSKLNNIGEQLLTDLDQWDTTEKELLEVIDHNSHLEQLFQYYRSCLEQRQTEISPASIPQGITLDPVAPKIPKLEIKNRGVAPDDEFSEAKSTEIVNAFIRIASTDDPAASVKKVNDFEKLKQSVLSVIPKI